MICETRSAFTGVGWAVLRPLQELQHALGLYVSL